MLFEVVGERNGARTAVRSDLTIFIVETLLSPGIPGKVTQMAGHGCRVMAISLLVSSTTVPSEWSVHVVDGM